VEAQHGEILMNRKGRLGRNLLFALLCGVAASALYWGLSYTNTHHGFSVMMLDPAWEFRRHHHPNCGTPLRCRLETLVVNAALYAFWIMIALVGFDVLAQLRRKLAH
jgi:hypothetical protein